MLQIEKVGGQQQRPSIAKIIIIIIVTIVNNKIKYGRNDIVGSSEQSLKNPCKLLLSLSFQVK